MTNESALERYQSGFKPLWFLSGSVPISKHNTK
jgi:hypothetical protein